MILLAHMLFGAAIGVKINNPFLAVILAFLGHYFLDLLPHIEYSIDNIKNKNWKNSALDFLKVFLDLFLGIIIIYTFLNPASREKELIAYLCAFVALIPDGSTLVSLLFPNKTSAKHDWLHMEKVHFLKHKKIPKFWRVLTQVLAVIISIILIS